VHKEILNTAGIKFSGHTEYLANKTNSKQTIMLFVIDNLKVALATTHIPLKEVPIAITQEKLIALINLLNIELKNKFKIANPRILVAGLNPHAGEGGYLGREEIDVITPALNQLRNQGLLIEGPLPADTLFTPHMLTKQDVIVGMYHDQVLPLIKHIGFDKAVNMTLGLPFIRTSVDHGTALSLAGTHQTDAGSMKEAIKLAIARAL
jgi:4-hydroxythreonine-4-phosphate dehydrogenase